MHTHETPTAPPRRPALLATLVVALLAACAALAGPAAAGSRTPRQQAEPTRAPDPDLPSGIDAAIAASRAIVGELMAELEFPGLSVAVAVDGEIAWRQGFGLADLHRDLPVTPESVFPIYSVSKALTGLTLARMAETGAVDLDAPISTWLPEVPEHHAEVTPRLLAGHLAGVRHYRPGAGEGTALRHCGTARQGIRPFVNDPLVHAPGTDFAYTSYGFVLLSAVLEAAGDAPFSAVMRRELLDPLGMTSTSMRLEADRGPDVVSTYEVDDDGTVTPARRLDRSCKMGAGAYFSTATDVARAADAVLTGRFLEAGTRETVFTPQRNAAGEEIVKGLGWDVGTAEDGSRWVRHIGGNVDAWSALVALPEPRVSVVLLANMRGRDWIHEEALEMALLFRDALRAAEASGEATAGAEQTATEPAIAITGAWVLPMDRERALPAQTVLVRGDEIVAVGPDHAVEIPEDAARIAAGGRWLLPGLVDAHVHADADASTLFLANGVTSVRRMHGDPEALEWRRSVRAGEVVGPRVLVAGPLLAGEEVTWPHELVEDPETARALVARQAEAGYDFVKPYDGLRPEVYAAIVEEAGRRGLPVMGHVSRQVGIEAVLDAGQRTLEHTEKLLYAAFGRSGVMSVPLERLEEIVEVMEGADAFLTPTLAGMEYMMRRGTPWHEALFHRPSMRHADPGLADWWSLGRGNPPGLEDLQRRRHFLMLQEELTVALHEAGVRLLAGTDTPYPLLVPGFSLHDELAKLVEIGLTPYEALRAATLHAGLALGDDRLGVIRPGATADLILLAADPRDDIEATRRPDVVVAAGRVIDPATLLAR